MAKLKKSVTIHAPVEKVFIFINDRAVLPEIWPHMIEVNHIQSLRSGGHSYHWVYRLVGMRFEGTSVTTEFILNKRLVDHNIKGIPSSLIWTFEPLNGGTKLAVECEYIVPTPVLGIVAEALSIGAFKREVGTLLANVKGRMEVLTIA